MSEGEGEGGVFVVAAPLLLEGVFDDGATAENCGVGPAVVVDAGNWDGDG